MKRGREGGGEPPSRSLHPQGYRGRPSPRLQRKQLRVCHWASVSLPELMLGSGCWELYWRGTVPLRVLDPWRGRIVAESLFASWRSAHPSRSPRPSVRLQAHMDPADSVAGGRGQPRGGKGGVLADRVLTQPCGPWQGQQAGHLEKQSGAGICLPPLPLPSSHASRVGPRSMAEAKGSRGRIQLDCDSRRSSGFETRSV